MTAVPAAAPPRRPCLLLGMQGKHRSDVCQSSNWQCFGLPQHKMHGCARAVQLCHGLQQGFPPGLLHQHPPCAVVHQLLQAHAGGQVWVVPHAAAAATFAANSRCLCCFPPRHTHRSQRTRQRQRCGWALWVRCYEATLADLTSKAGHGRAQSELTGAVLAFCWVDEAGRVQRANCKASVRLPSKRRFEPPKYGKAVSDTPS